MRLERWKKRERVDPYVMWKRENGMRIKVKTKVYVLVGPFGAVSPTLLGVHSGFPYFTQLKCPSQFNDFTSYFSIVHLKGPTI